VLHSKRAQFSRPRRKDFLQAFSSVHNQYVDGSPKEWRNSPSPRPPHLFKQTQERSQTEIGTPGSGCIGPYAMLVRVTGNEWKDQLASRLDVALQSNFGLSLGGGG
jgi:hypothetical protein